MEDIKNENEITVEELIKVLKKQDMNSIVLNSNGENIKIYPGRENKKGGRTVIMVG